MKRVKATTVHKYHANISKALKYAVEKNFIPYSVMGKVKRPKKERFVGKFLNQSEAVALFEAVRDHKLELGVILGAYYGLRRSEIVGLKWDAIDFEANSITIEHTVTVATMDGKRITIADDTTKSKSSYRTLPFVPQFRAKLLELKAEQEQNKKLCGNSYNQESCANLLLASGVPLKQIQEWLGHSDFAITANTYAHLDYNSKLLSASAMTWIDQTNLAQSKANLLEVPNGPSVA